MTSFLVGLHGLAQSGKTTTSTYLQTEHRATEYSFASPLKDVCSRLYGLTVEQMEDSVLKATPIERLGGATPRYILQRFGTNLVREHHAEALPLLPYKSLWLDLGKERITTLRKQGCTVVASDCRFEDEITAIQSMGGYVLGIERLSCLNGAGSHVSETVQFIKCDGVVCNNGSLDQLKDEVSKLFSLDPTVSGPARHRASLEREPAQTRADLHRARTTLKSLSDDDLQLQFHRAEVIRLTDLLSLQVSAKNALLQV